MPQIEFLSKEESQKQEKTFSNVPLVIDDYICKVVDIDPQAIAQTYDSFKLRGWKNPDEVAILAKESPESVEDVVRVKLLVYGLKSGDPLKDQDGNDVTPLERVLLKDIKPFAGFNKKDNTPTDYRMFFASALRQDAMKPFTVENLEDITGKYVAVEVALSSKGKNVAKKFKRMPDSFKPDEALEAAGLEAFAESEKRLQEWRDKNAGKTAVKTAVEDVFGDSVSFEDKPF